MPKPLKPLFKGAIFVTISAPVTPVTGTLPDRLPAQAGLMEVRMWFVYILKSEGHKWYYIGSTNRLTARIVEHNAGKVASTKNRKPLSLVYSKEFSNEKEARQYERRLKDKRIEKEGIIRQIEGVL